MAACEKRVLPHPETLPDGRGCPAEDSASKLGPSFPVHRAILEWMHLSYPPNKAAANEDGPSYRAIKRFRESAPKREILPPGNPSASAAPQEGGYVEFVGFFVLEPGGDGLLLKAGILKAGILETSFLKLVILKLGILKI